MKKVIAVIGLIALAIWVVVGFFFTCGGGPPEARWEIKAGEYTYRVATYYQEGQAVAFESYHILRDGEWVFVDKPLVVRGSMTIRRIK